MLQSGMLLSMDNPWPGAGVRILERTGSTMDDAHAWALDGCAEGSVVVAGFQEAGRGRFADRRWLSDPWRSLLCTVILDSGAPERDRLTSLLSGLAVTEAVRDLHGLEARIKWPNDVLIGGRKLSGILCERRDGRLLVGVGLNANQAVFPGDLSRTAVSLRQVLGHEVEILPLCARFLARLRGVVTEARGGSPSWRERIEERLDRMGEMEAVTTGGRGGAVSGRIAGIDADGALLLRAEDGTVQRVLSRGI